MLALQVESQFCSQRYQEKIFIEMLDNLKVEIGMIYVNLPMMYGTQKWSNETTYLTILNKNRQSMVCI